MGMDGHGCHGHGHGHGQGRTGGKKMRERLVRLTGEKTKVQTRPLQTCTPHCHPIPGPGRDGSGASGMKQFVESSSHRAFKADFQDSPGGSQTEFWFGSPRGRVVVDASQAQARNGPPTKITVLYTVPVSACRWQRRSPHLHLIQYGILPSVPVPGLGLVPAWKH